MKYILTREAIILLKESKCTCLFPEDTLFTIRRVSASIQELPNFVTLIPQEQELDSDKNDMLKLSHYHGGEFNTAEFLRDVAHKHDYKVLNYKTITTAPSESIWTFLTNIINEHNNCKKPLQNNPNVSPKECIKQQLAGIVIFCENYMRRDSASKQDMQFINNIFNERNYKIFKSNIKTQ